MDDRQDTEIDQLLKQTYGRERTVLRFEDWKKAYPEELAYLNPVVTKMYATNRRRMLRIVGLVVAASVVLVIGSLVMFDNRQAFASTAREIRAAKTMSWEVTVFRRCFGPDRNQSWLIAQRIQYEHRAPGLFRVTRFDHEGSVEAIEVVDVLEGERIRLDVRAKTYSFVETLNERIEFPPLRSLLSALDSSELEYLGRRNIEGRSANVFRHTPAGLQSTTEIWVDANSRRLIGAAIPSLDVFDPRVATDWGTPPASALGEFTVVGSVWGNIRFNTQLDSMAFSFRPPSDYLPEMDGASRSDSEDDFAQLLGVACKANNGVFLDSIHGNQTELYNRIEAIPEGDRTEDQQAFFDQILQSFISDSTDPFSRFMDNRVVNGSFRYIGKGVLLGQQDRIVCYYQLPGASDYRAVYGDLQIRSLSVDELPLRAE